MMAELKDRIESSFDGATVKELERHRVQLTSEKGTVLSLLGLLKDHGFDHLSLISCVDMIEEDEFELVYVLSRYMEEEDIHREKEKVNLILKTRIPRDSAEMPTSIHVFDNAEPYERELHEMFGINFEGHPRQEPLFLEMEYDVPPFRRDFDTREYVEDKLDSIPEVED